MTQLILFLIFVVDVVVIIDIIRGNKDMEKKLLWIIAVVFLPVVGPILYYFIGKN